MSKAGKQLGNFFVGSLLATTLLSPAFAQSVPSGDANQVSVFSSQGSSGDRSFNDLSSAEARRNQLLGTSQRAPDPTPPAPVELPDNTQRRAIPAGPAGPVSNLSALDQTPLGNAPESPVQSGTPATIEADPFAPTGFRLGTFDVNVSIEQAIGYSDNVSQQAGGEAGGFSETSLDATITSNWSRHQWQTSIDGSYRRPFDGDEVDQPQLQLNTSLRLDLIDGYTATTRGFYNISTQGFTSSTLAPGAVDNPIQENWGASLELQRTDRKLQFSLTGDIDRDEFQPADLGNGIIQNEGDQNNTEYGITARVGYEISPALTPFVEGRYAIRDFDQESDRNGNDRDSNSFELRGGVEVDMGEKLTGEIALGYVSESFEDPALNDLDAFTLDGQLNWSPERDTQVSLTLGTSTNNSINAGENGSIIYSGRVEVDRQLTSRLSMNAFASAQVETNEENNTIMEAGVGAQYWVNRFMAVTGQIDYLRFQSDAPGSDFDATSGQIGIRLQR